jgi:SAM-dependent methyltransferase
MMGLLRLIAGRERTKATKIRPAELEAARKQVSAEVEGLRKQVTAEVEGLRKQVRQLEHIVAKLAACHYGDIPLPPEELRLHVGTNATVSNFLAQGLNSSRRVLEIFGEDPDGPILDWGCGSGRTARWLQAYLGWRENYVGCDVDVEAIAWLRQVGGFRAEVCGDMPPLPFGAATFFGVFAFSVLTHIPPSGIGRGLKNWPGCCVPARLHI